jgi:hypothetical protein
VSSSARCRSQSEEQRMVGIQTSESLTTAPQRETLLPHVATRALFAILVVSFCLRAGCSVLWSGAIDPEGAEYARIAQNLLSGAGYVGIATPGTQLFFPPLFPFAIAAVSLVVGDVEVAGRLISVVLGSFIVVPVFLITRRLYFPRAAIVAAALVGCHPFLVYISTTVFSEATYLTLILSAIFMAMRAVDRPTPVFLLLVGASYGLAYLVRPEALAYLLVGAGLFTVRFTIGATRYQLALLMRLLLVLCGFLVLASPYICWLSIQTHQFRTEGKTPLMLSIEQRVQRGMSINEATSEVDPDLAERGVLLQPNLAIVAGYHMSVKELLKLLATNSKKAFKDAMALVAGGLPFGSPALFGLAVLGLFGRPWPPGAVFDHLHLAGILALAVAATFFADSPDQTRYFIIPLACFCIWGSSGLEWLAGWASCSASTAGTRPARQTLFGAASATVAAAGVLIPAAASAATQFMDDRAELAVKQAAKNLAEDGTRQIRIADTQTIVAFEAHARLVWLPYCEEATALRYLHKNHVTDIVLEDKDASIRPYMRKWLESGVPDSRLILAVTSRQGHGLKIYHVDQ